MCSGLYNHHLKHLKKNKKQPETPKQDGKWQKVQWSKEREIDLISKKSVEKKGNVNKLIATLLHVKVIKTLQRLRYQRSVTTHFNGLVGNNRYQRSFWPAEWSIKYICDLSSTLLLKFHLNAQFHFFGWLHNSTKLY